MRILVGMPSEDSRGGPIYCEPPFVRALRAMGVEVDEETYVYGDSARAVSARLRVQRVLSAARRLRQRIRDNEYDVVHLNTSIDEKCVVRDLITMAMLRASGVPVHLKMHGSIASFLATTNPFWRRAQRRLFARAADIGVLSSEERENFINAGCPPEMLSHAIYCVEAADFVRDPDFRAVRGIAAEIPILLFSARFIPAKGLLDVIDACAILRNEGCEFVLYCLGDGPQRVEAESLVTRLGLTEHIRFTGYITEAETAAFHANSDIFVFPTYHDEGFPLVLLKSIAAGLAIVTTPVRAAADNLTGPENCLWTKPQDPQHLAGQIKKLIASPELRHKMSENNRELAKKFTPVAVATEYIDLYRRIAG